MFTTRRNAIAGLGSILIDCCSGCHRGEPEPVTLLFVDPRSLWQQRRHLSGKGLRQFESETGIRVKHLPATETPREQLRLIQQLIAEKDTPDVCAIDVIWSGILDGALLDLKPFFSSELSAAEPDLVSPYTVKGRVLAIPNHPYVNVLYYRSDLLAKYGYHIPPQTWSELEKMAFRIQEGERAAGDKTFWGFVWPGAADEYLTCLALEWQASEGGGMIIESNRTISVNNENAIRAWQRAAHWIGWISPPDVTVYEDLDSANCFEDSGKAAFALGWTSDYFLTNPATSMKYGKMGVTSVPSGKIGVGTLGGFGLAISASSKHQREAIAFVRFLLREEAEFKVASISAELPAAIALYRLPTMLKAYSRSMPATQPPGDGIVIRPSALLGRNYQDVSLAYAETVHSVLTEKKSAPEAAAELEKELEHITGFPKGPPEPIETVMFRAHSPRS
jgi:trehalose/maltose transport system substrate-binding protein